MVVAIGSGHGVEVDKRRSHEDHGAEAGDQQLEACAMEGGRSEDPAHDLHHHGDQQADDAEAYHATKGLADAVAHAPAHHRCGHEGDAGG